MLQAAPVDVWTTDRKVYAEGARVNEIPLARPAPGAVENGTASVQLPTLRRPRRRMFRRLNHCAIPGYAPLCMDTNDPDVVGCAFRQRLLRAIPKPKPHLVGEFRSFVRAYLTRHVSAVTVPSVEEWLATAPYTQERKTQLLSVYHSLHGGSPTPRQCSHVDSFVKSEFYVTWKHARIINSRSDAFKVWSGPFFKAIEDELYRQPEFIKHTPVPERPKKISSLVQAGARYFQTDFTAYESHFTPALMDACECELYRHCLRGYKDRTKLCDVLMGENRMRTRTGIKAVIQGRRMSGDMCTSLGNGFTNLMLAKFLAYKHGGRIDGFVEGDDGIFSCNFDLNAKDYADLGFTIKIDEVRSPSEASFCGMLFNDSGEIIRDPRRFVMGFGWTQSFINAGPRIMDELLRAKALSALYETPQCPIVGAFAHHALSRTTHVHPRFVRDGFHVMPDEVSIPRFNPSPKTRELFSHLYGISPSNQILIEEAVSRGDYHAVSSLMPPTKEQETYAMNYVVPT